MRADLEALQELPTEQPVQDSIQEINQAEIVDNELYSAASPKGKFSVNGLNLYIDAINKVTPMFGLEKYEYVKESDVFPADLTRLSMMIQESITDAIDEGIFNEELAFNISEAESDKDLRLFASRLSIAGKSKPFKKFLSEGSKEQSKEEVMMEEVQPTNQEMSDKELEALFASRM